MNWVIVSEMANSEKKLFGGMDLENIFGRADFKGQYGD